MNEALQTSIDHRGIATLMLNRPEKANCFNQEMLAAISGQLAALGTDPAVRAIVLRGAGKHFSGGAEVGGGTAQGQASSAKPAGAKATIPEVCVELDTVAKPTVALVQGACVGGGLALAACCDMVLASRDAFFSIPEVRLGLPSGSLTAFFVRAIGLRNFRRFGLTGERFGAEEALRIGLVHQLAQPQRLEEALSDLLEEILRAAPNAVANVKSATLKLAGSPLPQSAMEELEAAFAEGLRSSEALEGRASFAAKREPSWYPKR